MAKITTYAGLDVHKDSCYYPGHLGRVDGIPAMHF
jgi:hypothetical protein